MSPALLPSKPVGRYLLLHQVFIDLLVMPAGFTRAEVLLCQHGRLTIVSASLGFSVHPPPAVDRHGCSHPGRCACRGSSVTSTPTSTGSWQRHGGDPVPHHDAGIVGVGFREAPRIARRGSRPGQARWVAVPAPAVDQPVGPRPCSRSVEIATHRPISAILLPALMPASAATSAVLPSGIPAS